MQELAQLKASAEDLKSQVDFLMEAQKKSRQQEEVLALRELRRTVAALKLESEALEQQKRAVSLLMTPHACMRAVLYTPKRGVTMLRTAYPPPWGAFCPPNAPNPEHAPLCKHQLSLISYSLGMTVVLFRLWMQWTRLPAMLRGRCQRKQRCRRMSESAKFLRPWMWTNFWQVRRIAG
jgi:hypothetical protein